jgi:hypothetical protein
MEVAVRGGPLFAHEREFNPQFSRRLNLWGSPRSVTFGMPSTGMRHGTAL